MTAPTHQGLYRSPPLILGGVLGSIVLLVVGVAAAWQIATSPSQRPLVLGTLGGFVLTFAVCGMAALRRHRWTLDAYGVLIEERPLLPFIGRRRVRRVPFGFVASLSNDGADELALTTREGERFVLPAGPAPRELAAFAVRLQAAMSAALCFAPPVTGCLGYSNRPSGSSRFWEA